MKSLSFRHRVLPLAAAAVLAAAATAAAQTYRFDEDDEPIPTGPEILARARQAFPPHPVAITARLERRTEEAEPVRTLNARLRMDWGALPPTARFEIEDAFGSPLAEMDIVYLPGGALIDFRAGDPPEPAPTPPMEARVFDTDFTWGDLALGFLWWPGGEMRGFQSRRGRRCFVVDVQAPEPTEAQASVRLWIDAFAYALLQAETYDAEGEPVRRLSVRSLRRVDGLWTAEDLEVRDLRRRTRTHLNVRSLEVLAPDDEADGDRDNGPREDGT